VVQPQDTCHIVCECCEEASTAGRVEGRPSSEPGALAHSAAVTRHRCRAQRRLGAVLTVGLLLLLGVGSTAAQDETAQAPTKRPDPKVVAQKMVAGWQKELDTLEEFARNGKLDNEFRSRADGLLSAMEEHIATGHRKLLARALRASALASLEVHDERSALWVIETARLFWPGVTEALDSFGHTGKHLASLMGKEARLSEEARELDPTQEGVLPPHAAAPIRLRYPRAARVARLEGTIGLEVVIDRAGNAHLPQIVDGTTSTRATALLVGALDTLRETHFQPGTRQDWPVPSFHTVSLRFRKP
jgi:hypothetical protein